MKTKKSKSSPTFHDNSHKKTGLQNHKSTRMYMRPPQVKEQSKVNRYLISVDIEGISGVVDGTYTDPGKSRYSLGQRYMSHDVNAVIEGILSEDPSAQILVRDAHGSANNLDLFSLHPQAYLLQGWGNSLNMAAGLEEWQEGMRGIFLVGYHGGGHNDVAVMGHTMSSLISELRINGKVFNEAGIVGVYASHFGIPVVFLSGDNQSVEEAHKQFSKGIITVEVKKSLARNSIISYPLPLVAQKLKAGAAAATTSLPTTETYLTTEETLNMLGLKLPLNIEIKLNHIGFKKSFFQNLYELYAFDQTIDFNPEERSFNFTADNPALASQRFSVLLYTIYGLRNE